MFVRMPEIKAPQNHPESPQSHPISGLPEHDLIYQFQHRFVLIEILLKYGMAGDLGGKEV